MKPLKFILFLFLPAALMAQQNYSSHSTIVFEFEKTPFWQDEFDKEGLPDSSKWNYDIGGHGWGNNELQYYTSQNAFVQNGVLTIQARKESYKGKSYTSSRMVTKGKASFLYGRFEIKAKLPEGKGLWPAIWMLPIENKYGNWPESGEIDIMEQVGYAPYEIHISAHTELYNWPKGTQKTAVLTVPACTKEFHIYRLDWTPEKLIGYVDSIKVFEFKDEKKGHAAWPFHEPFYLLLNVAVGGNWGGQKGIDDTIFPAGMMVDYVRVYKLIQP